MHLPAQIKDLFTQKSDGAPSIRIKSASEAITVENALKKARIAYKTKSNRTKKHGREFLITLVEPANGA